MMLQTLRVGSKEFKFDPETIFWGTGDSSDLKDLYARMQEGLLQEMSDLRFNTEILLFYVNCVDGCNAHCPYCYLPGKVKDRKRAMGYRELETLLTKGLAYWEKSGIKGTIVFHGSEPLLNKENIFRIIERYSEDVHFGIQTNGLLLSKEHAEFIQSRNVSIGISLDSPEQETNDLLRGQGHFRKVDEALGWFKGYTRLSVVTTITHCNVHQLAQMVRYLHAKEVLLCLMNPVRATQSGALAFRPALEDLAKHFIEAVEEAIGLAKAGRRIVVGDFANALIAIIAPSARVMMCDISPCGGGRRFLSITAEGSAYPCGEFIGMEEFMGGNIFTQTFENIVASAGFQRVRERVVEKIPECDACLLRNVCGAPCPAEIYATAGTMFEKSYYCEFYKKVAEHAFEVIHRNDVEHVIRKSAFEEMYNLEAAR